MYAVNGNNGNDWFYTDSASEASFFAAMPSYTVVNRHNMQHVFG